jgi:cytochrome c oxidase cbb3-type subunit III
MRTIFLILLASVVLAQDPGNAARQQSTESPEVAAGKTQFGQTCGFCHGLDARGGANGPDLLHSSLVSHDIDGNLIGPVVHHGRPEKGMPAFQLSDAEISRIAQFLHAQAKIAASVYQRIPSEYPLEKLLVGNAANGKAYFNGEGNCVACHSVTGDLAHIASKYKPFDLQTRIAFPSGAETTITVKDASGKTWGGTQVYADEFLVTLRDKTGWMHTWKRDTVDVQTHNPLAAHEKLLKTYTDKSIHDLFAYLETLK